MFFSGDQFDALLWMVPGFLIGWTLVLAIVTAILLASLGPTRPRSALWDGLIAWSLADIAGFFMFVSDLPPQWIAYPCAAVGLGVLAFRARRRDESLLGAVVATFACAVLQRMMIAFWFSR